MGKKKKRRHASLPQDVPPPKAVTPTNSKRKTIIDVGLLLALLVIGVAFAALKASQGTTVSASQSAVPQATATPPPPDAAPQASATVTPQQKPAKKIVVYYFHGTYRCPSCTTIEQLTEFAVFNGFQTELMDC